MAFLFKRYIDILLEKNHNLLLEANIDKETLKKAEASARAEATGISIGGFKLYKPLNSKDANNFLHYRIFNPYTKKITSIKNFKYFLEKSKKENNIQALKDAQSLIKVLSQLKKKFDQSNSNSSSKISSPSQSPVKSKEHIDKSIQTMQKTAEQFYKEGFVKNAAPGNPGSMLNELGSNESAHIFFSNESLNESDAVAELYKKLKDGKLLSQQSSGFPKDITKTEIKKIKEEHKELANVPDNQIARIILAVRSGKAKASYANTIIQKLKWDKKDVHYQGFFGDKTGLEMQRQIVQSANNIYAPDGSKLDPKYILDLINSSGKADNPSDTAQFLINKKTGDISLFFTSDKDSVDAIVANSTFVSENKHKQSKNEILLKNKQISEKDFKLANDLIESHTKEFQKIEEELKNVSSLPVKKMQKKDPKEILNTLKTLGTKYKTNPDKYYKIIMKKYKKENTDELTALKNFLNKASNNPNTLTSDETKILAKLSDNLNINNKEIKLEIEKIRKKSLEVEIQLKEKLNKIKVKIKNKEIGLGNYHDAYQIIEKMHLKGALNIKEGIYAYPGLFKVISGGITIDDKILQDYLHADNVEDFILRFESGIETFQRDANGNITGSSKIIYFLDEKGNKIKIAEKRQRSKEGILGKFSTIYAWADDIKKYFKEQNKK